MLYDERDAELEKLISAIEARQGPIHPRLKALPEEAQKELFTFAKNAGVLVSQIAVSKMIESMESRLALVKELAKILSQQKESETK